MSSTLNGTRWIAAVAFVFVYGCSDPVGPGAELDAPTLSITADKTDPPAKKEKPEPDSVEHPHDPFEEYAHSAFDGLILRR